jgi:predicted enzyme related to lactoylglutathione lyase
MPEFPKPVTGTFCWVELQAKDLDGAKKFYGGLFGWTFEDLAIAEGKYTVAKVGGTNVAGLMPQLPQAAQMGGPPSWAAYVAVDDVKASTDAAARLGAEVLVPPTPMGPGTFAVLADPTAAVFLLWHTTQPMGSFLYGEPGALSWNELLTSNADVAQRFYTQLFGWKGEAMPMPEATYTVFKQRGTSVGGLMQQPPHLKGAPSMWTSYFAVADADATVATAARLGAKVLMPLTDIPDVGRFAWLQDPQGAVFAIIKNATPA